MVDLRPDHLAIVQAILSTELPGQEVWAFGSRARWTARDNSDLDLVVIGDRPLPLSTLTRLRRAFEESYLPLSVDVVDWSQLSEEFRSVILSQKAVIQAPGEGGQKRREERAWKTVPLKECVDVLTGGTPQRSNPAYWNGDIPWAAPQDLGPLQLRDTADHVTPAAIGHGTRLAPEGAVLILVRGATLSREVPVCITRRPMAFHQNIRALLPRPGVLADYLAYFLLANQAALSTLVQGTSRGTGQINSAALASFPLAVPPSSEQQALARILLALDDKMELNRRMNETLESLARAVFKSWLES